ncbi:hypothetical protein BEL04_16845 [Mucilaginibacter sp. PPCGB 2223]|uniref:DUF3667 domain-containing protein n=1 Tax=Mucilaginibacter sp. PPCGB 2223 TaxID=1886027 RepID=UPI000824B6AD|nr:DUF3667 domain-containing protein [Mucilaginibacter sp. PPCGB 2223]OCX51684.1 hypothetical protein BEL04_16845 [Mucilaginibacter sp. PPCGB 2223]
MKHHHRHENDCLNCGAELQGHYCHDCGQENLTLKEPFWHFLGHSISHYFHFDEKFFNTLVPLLTKPGQLTLAYLDGKRTKYLQPVSMYIFVSIFYFLVVPHLQHKADKDEDDDQIVATAKVTPGKADSLKKAKDAIMQAPMPEIARKEALKGMDRAIAKARNKSFEALPFARQTVVLDSLKAVNKAHPSDSLQEAVDDHTETYIAREDSTYASYLKRQAKLPEDERDGFWDRYKKRRDIDIKQRTGKDWSLDKEIEHYQPKLYFILMPLFAFFIMLNFRKNHRYYVEHIVFTIHFFTAFFIFEIVAVPINHFIFNDSELFSLLSYAVVIWYAYTALRTFYQRPPWLTIRKMVTLGICLSIAFGISYEIIRQVVYMLA